MIELNLQMLIDGHETRRAPSNIFLGLYHSQRNTNKPTRKAKKKQRNILLFPLILPSFI